MKKDFFVKRKIKYKKFFIKNYRKTLILFSAIGILIVLFTVFIERGSEIEEKAVFLEEEKEEKVFRLIDGKEVSEEDKNPFLISAIIDNHSKARPQFALSSASLVYDVPAEGGIDRYLAFFPSDLEEDFKIGPIRSARPYFLDIAKDYEALLLHCGGSPEALNRIEEEGLLTLNEFYKSHYFERYQAYLAPHNVLADYGKIKKYLKNNNLEHSNFVSWSFKNDNKNNQSLNSFSIKIKNKNSFYDTEWVYDLSSNSYFKKISGEKHLDSQAREISAKNIIFQFIDSKILDDALRIKIEMLGEGDAIICLDGSCHDALWRKNEDSSRTFYYNEEGEEFVFNRGITWIHFIDKNTSVEIN